MARFLVIDDDNTLRQLIAFTLESAGHRVQQAASGAEGTARFAHEQPDVVVTDLVMPRDSIELVIELSQRHRGTPFVVISGTSDTPNHREIARLLGAKRTVAKPFRLADFLRAIEQVLADLNEPPPKSQR